MRLTNYLYKRNGIESVALTEHACITVMHKCEKVVNVNEYRSR